MFVGSGGMTAAATSPKSVTVVGHNINRGNENFMEKLVELGAKDELPGSALV